MLFIARYGAALCFLILITRTSALGIPAVPLPGQPKPDTFGRQVWQTENGLPQNTVHTILQSRDGYIWVGTEGGLARFDGIRFFVYNTQNTRALRSNNIRMLVQTRDGSLWIATADGIGRIKNGQFSAFNVDNGLPSANVWSLSEDGGGNLWAVTADGLARFSGNYFQPYPISDAAAITGAIASGNDGTVWIGTRNGIRTVGTNQPTESRGQEKLPNNDIEQLLLDSNGTKWIGTANGLYEIKGGAITAYTTKNGLPANRITAIYEDRSRTVWVGTDAGLTTIAHGLVTPLSPNDALSAETILSIVQDREGNIWVGTASSGLNILRPQHFATYTARNGLPDDQVRCVFQDREGAIWIGTNAGGLARYQQGRFSVFTIRDGLASDVILALAQDPDGTLLVGTPDGLNLIRHGTVSLLTSADGLPDDFVRSILADRDGRLWIGTRRGLACFKDGRFTAYSRADGLGSDLVGAMLADGNGGLWISTLHGLTHLQNGKLRNYTTADGLSSNIVTALFRDKEGVLWIGTQDGGLNVLIKQRFVRFPASLNLPTTIYGIAEDLDGDLWISSNTGIYRVSRQDLAGFAGGHETAAAIAYGTSDGLKVSETSGGGHPAIWRTSDGSLWFATVKGVAVVHGPHPHLNRVPPGVVIEAVFIDDRKVNPAELTSIPPGYSRLSFEYAGLSFAAPQKVRFRYKLEGFDRNWVEAGERRIAYYTNLPPGRYRFRVLARNNDGFWNENGASVAFRLDPHFYQTYWFYALMLAALAFAGWSVYRRRLRYVQARFDAVLQERNRIAREIHDTLAQGFAGVSVQLEIVSRLLESSKESAREHLDNARLLVRRSLADARSSIWELRSQSAVDEDLAARFTRMANQVVGSGPPKVELQVRGAYRPLSPKLEQELLKIAQEALTNAVRHANAQRIEVELAFDGGKLRMTISDNGQGFTGVPESTGPNGHFGLRGMHERAEIIDAELKVQTAAGKGTVISVETAVK